MGSRWTTLLALIVVLIAGSSAARADDERPSAELIAQLRVFVDGKGRVFAHVREYKKPPDSSVYEFGYFGDKKTLYLLDGQSYDAQRYGISDPRGLSTFRFERDQAILQCKSKDSATFTEMPPAEARKLLAAATFKGVFWNHTGYLFARDDGTTYVYVDRARESEVPEFRIFVGKRGAMKAQKILDLATDEVGDVLITPAGTLRTTITSRTRDVVSATWAPAKRKQKEPLILLPLSSKLIFGDLGVYTGERMGLPCD